MNSQKYWIETKSLPVLKKEIKNNCVEETKRVNKTEEGKDLYILIWNFFFVMLFCINPYFAIVFYLISYRRELWLRV